MKKSFAFCLVSLALSGTSLADESEAARNARFAALLKTGDALVRKDFQGPFANYWHDSIDAARTNYEAALKADYTVPQKIHLPAEGPVEIFFRVGMPMKDKKIVVASAQTGESLLEFKRLHLAPGEMEHIAVPAQVLEKAAGGLKISIE